MSVSLSFSPVTTSSSFWRVSKPCLFNLLGSLGIGFFVACFNFTPADETEVSVHFAAKGDLVTDLSAHEFSEQNTSLFLERTHGL